MFIDIVFVLILIMAVVKGLSKGFILALFSVAGLIIGLAAAIKLSAMTAGYLKGSVNVSAKWLSVLSFILVFILAAFLVRIGAKMIEKLVEVAMLGWANRIAGVILYMLIYTIVLSVLLFYGEKSGLLNQETLLHSKTYSYIKPLGPAAINALGVLIPFFRNMFLQLEQFFGSISS